MKQLSAGGQRLLCRGRAGAAAGGAAGGADGVLAERRETAAERLLSVFDWLAHGHGREGFRGCPFTNAAVELPDPEHPARAVISAYQGWLRGRLTELADEAGLRHPEELGYTFLMLIDGANARVVVDGDRSALHRAKEAAARMITGGHG